MPDMEIVAAVRTRLIGRIGETRYDLWFGSQTRLVPEGDALLVVAPTRFYQDWLRRNFRDDLASSYREATGRAARLEFRIATEGDATNGDVEEDHAPERGASSEARQRAGAMPRHRRNARVNALASE